LGGLWGYTCLLPRARVLLLQASERAREAIEASVRPSVHTRPHTTHHTHPPQSTTQQPSSLLRAKEGKDGAAGAGDARELQELSWHAGERRLGGRCTCVGRCVGCGYVNVGVGVHERGLHELPWHAPKGGRCRCVDGCVGYVGMWVWVCMKGVRAG
jgi:hypothetical protein